MKVLSDRWADVHICRARSETGFGGGELISHGESRCRFQERNAALERAKGSGTTHRFGRFVSDLRDVAEAKSEPTRWRINQTVAAIRRNKGQGKERLCPRPAFQRRLSTSSFGERSVDLAVKKRSRRIQLSRSIRLARGMVFKSSLRFSEAPMWSAPERRRRK